MPSLADSHVHLDDERFDDDRCAVIARAQAGGVALQVVPSVDRNSWQRVADVVDEHAGIHAAYGLHPMFLHNHHENDLRALPDWLSTHRAVAVGEIGLDYYIDGLDHPRQQHFLDAQLAIARELDLPVILHARRAQQQVTLTLRQYKGLRGVVHSFAGSAEQASQLFDLGFHIGIGGPVTYDRAKRLHRVVAAMPIEQLVLETDAPDQPPADHRGERNEPAWLGSVLSRIAALRGESEAVIAQATTANVRRLFNLSDTLEG